jgi:hypothetical protein
MRPVVEFLLESFHTLVFHGAKTRKAFAPLLASYGLVESQRNALTVAFADGLNVDARVLLPTTGYALRHGHLAGSAQKTEIIHHAHLSSGV